MGLPRALSPKAEKDNLISERDTTPLHAALFGQAAASLNSLAPNELAASAGRRGQRVSDLTVHSKQEEGKDAGKSTGYIPARASQPHVLIPWNR